MNLIYHLIWNTLSCSKGAVAEESRPCRMGRDRTAYKFGIAILLACGVATKPSLAETPATTVVPANGMTSAYISANGVPVVDIAKANATGLSHNRYTNYNVENNGLVLNNGNSSQMSRQSQLAGQVAANLNLLNEAKVILNEVVTTNRSVLAGFTEVLGGKADVIVANPNGITCDGCGFLNTDRATLTTGYSNIAGDGSLQGFTVNQGDVLIEGAGANVSGQQIFDIVARSTKLNGTINTAANGSLGITTGSNVWNYTDREVTGSVASVGSAPSYAFDSAILGGMYAGRIRIVATEAGVGVRMLGEAAASADDFTLSSAGKIEIQSAVSAERDTRLISTSASGSQDIFINGVGAKVSAKRDLSLVATSGQVDLVEGELYAGHDLTLSSATLIDVSSLANTRYAGANNSITTSGVVDMSGSVWGAGSALSGRFDSFTVGANSATLYAASTLDLYARNDLSLGTAALHSVGDMSLSADSGNISTTADAAQGIQTSSGNLYLTAGNGLTHAGTMTADAGSVIGRIDGTFSNSGTVHGKTAFDIADKSNGSGENVRNSGTMLADGGFTAKATSFTNVTGGVVQGTTGTTLLANDLTNDGTFISSGTAGQSGTFTLDSLTNSGTLQSSEDLILNVTGTLVNAGKLLATHDLAVSGGIFTLAINNSTQGVMQAGNALTIAANNGTLDNQGGTVLGNSTNVTVASLDNSGTLQSNADMTLVVGNDLTNSGTLLAKTSLGIDATTLTNSGTLQGDQGSIISTTGALVNTGKLIASSSASHSGQLNVASLNNSSTGVIQSAQNIAINISGNTLSNSSTIIAANDLTITSTGSDLTLTNLANGYLQAGNNTGDTLMIGGGAVTLNNNVAGNILADQLVLDLTNLINEGIIQGGAAASTLTTSGTIDNGGTLTLASTVAGSGTITADTINNSGTLQSEGAALLYVANTLNNSGSLLSVGGLTVRGTDSSYSVYNSGRMQSSDLLDIKGQSGADGVDITVDTSGVLLGESMDVNANTLTINDGGTVGSAGNMDIAATSLSLGGSASRIVAATSGTGDATITLGSHFTNPGAVHSGENLTFSAPSITNNGGFSALNALTLQAGAGDIYNTGALYAGNQLNASASQNLTNVSSGTIDSDGSINLSAGATFTNNGAINASQDISIDALTFKNEIPGGVPARQYNEVWGNWYVTSMNGSWGWPDDAREYYQRDAVRTEYFVNGIPATKPQIIAGRNMNITNFTSAVNTGGVLAASSGIMTISGSGTFTNDDLSLLTTNLSQSGVLYEDCNVVKCFSKTFTPGGAWTTSTSTARSYGAGIFASDLRAVGFSLVNQSSPWAPAPTAIDETGAGSTSLGGLVAGASTSSGVFGVTTASGVSSINFNGLVISLPVNPNGYFVISRDPDARYLIETNPLFSVGSKTVGSNYMAERYGYNPDELILRLGDSNYEAYLVRQQLISQTGQNILAGYDNEADQMKGLMDEAIVAGNRDGFVYGKALTADQVANLEKDVVWMVETTVAGQKVLAPVIYLSANTREGIETGAVIAAEKINMDLNSVTNTGGTISGSESLNITSKGDITNTSGTIKGGDVSLKSTEGSIKNQTHVQGSGNDEEYSTSIGKTAGIKATGNLKLDAKKDILVTGGEVEAGGDASLTAGDNITFDTIVDKSTHTERSSYGSGFNTGSKTTTKTTEKNIGSTLKSGGNLKFKSGGDTTIAGSDVSTEGDLHVETGGDFNVIARQDKTTTKSVESTSGVGVGGGMAGVEKTTTDKFKGTNFGSTLTVGGNATVKAAKEMTVQGSDVTIGGDADINAKEGVNILDGLDEERTTTRTETTTFGKIDKSGESSSGTDSDSQSEIGNGYASKSEGTEANAETSGDTDVKLAETSVTTTKSGSNTSVASNFKVGGNLKVKTEGTLKVQGSNVESGGDMDLDAKNIEVLAGRNEEWSNTETTRTSVGLYNEGEAGAEANVNAEAKAGTVGTDASAGAGASAGASGTSTLGARTEEEKTSSYKLTHSSSSLKSGGNLSIKAKEEAKFVGAEVESGGDMNIEAKDITNMAAQDIEITTSSKNTKTAGLYADGDAGAEASSNADAGKLNIGGSSANAEANTGGSANASTGLRYNTKTESSVEGSVTNVTSSFKSGGNFTRKAQGTITDQGTQIEAGGNITQEAHDIVEIEAHDSTFSSQDSSNQDMKVGVGASASADAGAEAGGDSEGGGTAGAGVRGKYESSSNSESESTSTAVTTRYKAGGNITSKSEGKTTLIGTEMESGGDVTIEAGSLDYQAAKDTTSSKSNDKELNAELKVDVYGKAGASLDANYADEGESENTSTARTGSIKSAGNLTIKTRDDASFAGTQLEAGGEANIAAGGSVDFKAAQDTEESSKSGIDASLSLSSSKGSKGVSASAGYSQENSSSSSAQVGSIKAGKGGVNITAGKDASFEGTNLESEGDISIEAGGNVNLKAAKDTDTSTSYGVEVSVGGGKEGKKSSKSASAGGNVSYSKKVDSTGTSIDSGGKVTVKGNTIVNQEASIEGKGGKQIIGNEIQVKAEKTDISVAIEATVN